MNKYTFSHRIECTICGINAGISEYTTSDGFSLYICNQCANRLENEGDNDDGQQ